MATYLTVSECAGIKHYTKLFIALDTLFVLKTNATSQGDVIAVQVCLHEETVAIQGRLPVFHKQGHQRKYVGQVSALRKT